jgi:uncharacterized protein YgiM (DUF1202 family)
MKAKHLVVGLILVVCVDLLAISPVACREYVVMLSRNINIRTGPSTNRVVVGRAWKGDIFDLVGEDDNWFEIAMFSGERRYVSRSWAAKLTESQLVSGHRMELPTSGDTRWALYRDVRAAQARAKGEADELIPASVDEERNLNLRQVLEDRHALEVFSIYSIQPALYSRLMAEMAGNACH